MSASLLLVDDELEILESLKRTLHAEGWEILTTTSAREALRTLESRPIDVLVSDVRMEEMSGVELVAQVRRLHPRTTRVLLTGYATLDAAVAAINEGAVRRFLTKPWENDALRAELREVVREAREGRDRSHDTPAARVKATLDAAGLSPRLRQAGEALMTGASEKQIAAQLGVSPHTTHQYVKALYRRFGVSSRAELMARMQSGEIDPAGEGPRRKS